MLNIWLKQISIRDTPNKKHGGLGGDFQTRVIMKQSTHWKHFNQFLKLSTEWKFHGYSYLQNDGNIWSVKQFDWVRAVLASVASRLDGKIYTEALQDISTFCQTYRYTMQRGRSETNLLTLS